MQSAHLVPLDLIQLLDQLLAVLSLAEKFVQMRAPLLGRDDVAGEFLDVGLDVWPEDVEPAHLAFDVQQEIASPMYPNTSISHDAVTHTHKVVAVARTCRTGPY